MVLACVLELALDVCFGPHGCAKDGEPLFLGEQVLATGPNFWAEGFQAWLCLAELKNSFLEFFLSFLLCFFSSRLLLLNLFSFLVCSRNSTSYLYLTFNILS